MGDNAWTTSTCRSDVMWYGVPGQGTYYWTARYGQYWVGGGLYQRYSAPDIRWECGPLGAPVKEYQWLSEFSAYGMWFQFGAIYYKNGAWQVAFGNYGQTAGRLIEEHESVIPADAEVPPDAATEPPPAPKPPSKKRSKK
jgi:hypothetical protein